MALKKGKFTCHDCERKYVGEYDVEAKIIPTYFPFCSKRCADSNLYAYLVGIDDEGDNGSKSRSK